MKRGLFLGIGAVAGAGFLFRQWRKRRQALRAAQQCGDRVEVVARLRTLTEQAAASPDATFASSEKSLADLRLASRSL